MPIPLSVDRLGKLRNPDAGHGFWGRMRHYQPHQRVLLLGPTGVDKARVAERLRSCLKDTLGHQIRFVDFENDFLKPLPNVRSWMAFLGQDVAQQAATWRQAWEAFKPTLNGEITVLGLHAIYVSGATGLRCAIDIPSIIRDFRPTLIISLIDDVFSMWSRTEERAEGQDYRGRPSFEQLLVARRAEQLLGDVVLSHTGDYYARHILCATGNSLNVLVNLVVLDAGVRYLSFPISAPRKLEAEGDSSFIDLINHAHQLAEAEMKSQRSQVFITPLAIDELPILFKSEGVADQASLEFDCRLGRWDSDELWVNADVPILPRESKVLNFPMVQIEGAAGAMRTDVGWRDRRLVLQSEGLAIICPKPPTEDRITRGVMEEISTAGTIGIVSHYWQKPEWDPDGFVGNRFPPAGSMGIGQTEALVRRVDSLEELIRTKP